MADDFTSKERDRTLGMGAKITRRDFLNVSIPWMIFCRQLIEQINPILRGWITENPSSPATSQGTVSAATE